MSKNLRFFVLDDRCITGNTKLNSLNDTANYSLKNFYRLKNF